ncbi:bifunctional 5,10-methylenetetrahydrofolate dehydrogenase/5,10-methenyltetrahydrofolate cyclohydrolase [Candidatus Uhrbacteria bacterium]|nr:bifunctional 5,10-methylenetetrahydrofolate dehydrogenase/5,10-methenyltetrahydrofolate cyclohydrolase [Candidatus Uhrbacteria bacterium]
MHLINGKALAAKIRTELAQEVKAFGRAPRLNVLLVGDDAASRLYVDLKQTAGKEAGIDVIVDHRGIDTTQTELETLIEAWNADPAVDGILIQLPLPSTFDADALIQRIAIEKDADGFRPGNPNILSPLHEGILLLINETPLKLPGIQAVILANSDTFSKPLEKLLSIGGVSVDVMRPDDMNKTLLEEAELVVSAIGRPHFIPAAMLKDGAVLIDVGTTRENGKTHGDFDIDSIRNTDCWLTPVPGGVGPMTVALLLKNVLRLAKLR